MSASSRPELQRVIAALRQRWGADVLRSLGELRPAAHLPTGFAALDQVLSGSGLPCGAMTQLSGRPTSGMVTLALKMAVQAQGLGYAVVAVDCTRTLDLDYASRCGVNLEWLALVRPRSPLVGLEIVRDIAMQNIAAMFLFDASTPDAGSDDGDLLNRSLRRVKATLAGTPAALLCLTREDTHPCAVAVSPVAALQLDVMRNRWLHQPRDVVGYDVRVTVRKDQHGQPGQTVTLTVAPDGAPAP